MRCPRCHGRGVEDVVVGRSTYDGSLMALPRQCCDCGGKGHFCDTCGKAMFYSSNCSHCEVVMKYFVGVDPSLTHTGIVVLGENYNLVNQKALLTKPAKVNDWRDRASRIARIVEGTYRLIQQYPTPKLTTVYIEDYAPGKFMNSVIPLIELGGALRSAFCELERFGYSIVFVPPATLKKFATGAGNSNKVAVAASLAKRFDIDFGSDDNLYDAYALARMAMARAGHTDKLTAFQAELARKIS